MAKPSLDDLTPGQREALLDYRARNGRLWKALLLGAWSNGSDEREERSAELRQIRNQRGPSWLSALVIKEDS